MVEHGAKYLSRAKWPELYESISKYEITKAIMPIGSLEQHGPHLPLSTDITIANFVAEHVAAECDFTVLLPPIQLGCAIEHLGFTGTISLQPETLSNILLDTSHSLLKTGLTKFFIINGHGGNRPTIENALIKIKHAIPEMNVYSFTILDIVKQKFADTRKSPRRLVGHADEIETSIMLAIEPQAVEMDRAIREEPSLPRQLSFESEDMAKTSFAWTAKELTRSGVIGDPTLANSETGKILLAHAIETISRTVNEL